MPHVDARGIVLSSGTPASLAAFECSLSRLLNGSADATRPVDEALLREPGFAMGHALKAGAAVLADAPVETAAATSAIRALERSSGNDRERRHADAARAWLDGDPARAVARYGGLVADYPRDLLALQVALALDFRLGQREMLRDRVASVLPHWHADVAGFGHVLALYAFGLEETGDYDASEAAARRSLALVPDSAAPVHVLAHVCEMRGRPADGVALLERTREIWSSQPGFAHHLAWHLALFHIDLDAAHRAMSLYDTALAPGPATPAGALVDASALLWRFELRGMPVPARWRQLARRWKRRSMRGARAFNLVHAVIAHAGARAFGCARRTADLLVDDDATQRMNRPEDLVLASAMCAGIIAFAQRRYDIAVDRLRAVRAIAQQCGGSIAQCDLIHLTLIEAALRSRQDRFARALAAERAAQRPESRLNEGLFARALAA